MLRRCFVAVAVITLLASPTFAQGRVEFSGAIGYTFSEGIDFANGVLAPNGSIYNRVDPKSGVSFNFTFGGYVTEQAEIEFLWSRQSSTLEVTGISAPQLNGDMSVSNYHGNFVYNFGDQDMKARPFIFIGLGATQYGDATFPAKTVPGISKFSWSFGGGVKAWASPHVGVKAMLRWVPTYINTEAGGWWCDPYWGCGVVGNMKYSNQFELSGGLVARF
jgi:hypothetical protein